MLAARESSLADVQSRVAKIDHMVDVAGRVLAERRPTERLADVVGHRPADVFAQLDELLDGDEEHGGEEHGGELAVLPPEQPAPPARSARAAARPDRPRPRTTAF